MKKYLIIHILILFLCLMSFISQAQLSNTQQQLVKQKTTQYCQLLELLATDPNNAEVFGKLVELFNDATNNLVYNDLIPGNVKKPFMEYITMLRNFEGTIKLNYGTPTYYYTEQFGMLFGLAKIPKTISDGYGRTRTVDNVIVINLTNNKLSDIGDALPIAATKMNERVLVSNSSVSHTTEIKKTIFPSAKKLTKREEIQFKDFFQKGAELFDQDNLRGAITYFEKAIEIKPRDTFSIMNVISAAYNLESGPDGYLIEKYSRMLMDMKFRVDSTGYSGFNILSGYKLNKAGSMLSNARNEADSASARNMYAEALEVLNEGLTLFPYDHNLQMSSINAYIKLDKIEEAIYQIESVVIVNPDKQLYYNLGILYDKLGEIGNSRKSYKKAIEMDPNYYDAYFNLGAMYYTLGNKKYAEAGEYKNMNGDYTDEKGKELEEESKVFFREAAPAFEKVVALDASERKPFEVLQRIYWILGDHDKVEKMKKILLNFK